MVASLAHTAVTDACFGEDLPKKPTTKKVAIAQTRNDIVCPQWVKDWNAQF